MNALQLKLTAVVSIFVLVTACKKEDKPPTPPPVAECKLSNVYFFGESPTPTDSADYVYTGNLIAKMQFKNLYYGFEYNDEKVIKRSHYSTNLGRIYQYDTLLYNGAGDVIRIESFRNTGTEYDTLNISDFEYANGKLSKATTYGVKFGAISPDPQIYEYTYTGGNITKAVFTDYFFGQPTTIYNFTYDTKPNYFLKQSPQPWLTDLFMQSFFGSDLPLYISTNNVTEITSGSSTLAIITYATDSYGNLIEMKRDNRPQVRYAYDCR